MGAPSTVRSWNGRLLERWLGCAEPAIVDDHGVVTGDDLIGLAARSAALLDEHGCAPGAAVPALVDEDRTAIALVVAGALSRRPLAPLGTKLPPDDLVAAVRGLDARHLVASAAHRDVAARVAAAARVELVVVDDLPARSGTLTGECGPDDVVVIVHTSGTTGLPKPVQLRQRPLAARVEVYREVMDVGPGDRYCSASPFHHTAGVAMATTMLGVGATIVPQDWFSVDNWRRAGRLGVTCALLVPTMIDVLLAEGALADAVPRVLQYGAMPIHPDTLRAAMRVLPDTRFVQVFGQTEASPITSLSHADHVRGLTDRPELLRSVGRAVPGAQLRIERPDVEGVGELVVRAAHVFTEDDDGWRRTGDLGAIDGEGYVALRGRLGDRIIRGGENIHPIEIEHALLGHPGVREVAVVGVADRRWGELVKAVVVAVEPAAPPEPDDLRRFVADRLAHFKVPAIIEFREGLPRNASGKTLRHELR